MLPAHLTTNEVKNTAGAEIQFNRTRNAESGVRFEVQNPNPAMPHNVQIDHQIIGTGAAQRRRSRLRTEYTAEGEVDAQRKAPHIVNVTIDIPIGNVGNLDGAKMALANTISLLASTGADTVVKFDCSGTAADALINGSL